MSKALVYSPAGTKKEPQTLDKAVFDVQVNHELVGLAYRSYLDNHRQPNAKTLTRAEVRGGGKKPWRQKGTGRARAGSTRLPHWRHGGVAFGNTGQENYTVTIPAAMRRLAIKQAFSLQAADGKVVILEDFKAQDGKVKTTVQLLGKLNLTGQLLLAVDKLTPQTIRATRNLAGLQVVSANYLNVFDLLNADHIIITKPALELIGAWLGGKNMAEAKS